MLILKMLKKQILLLAYKLYGLECRRLRSLVLRVVGRIDGGQLNSLMLRKIYLDYQDIETGLYGYGGCFDISRI